jgi:hypothetical protein
MLLDAAAGLARLERRMAAAQSDGSATRHGLAAVELLDRVARLLETQHAAMVDQLAAVLRADDDDREPPVRACRGLPSRARAE